MIVLSMVISCGSLVVCYRGHGWKAESMVVGGVVAWLLCM